jgi:ribosome-binding protein aMBF1 (putative translation factor)
MSVHTRTHRTKDARVHTQGEETGLPWREVFKEDIENFTEPGLMLKGARAKENLTQKELAEKLGVKAHHISEMEHGKRPIGKAMAHRLATVLGVGYRVFL